MSPQRRRKKNKCKFFSRANLNGWYSILVCKILAEELIRGSPDVESDVLYPGRAYVQPT